MSILAPSILSADFSRLGEEIREVTLGGAGILHVDVMDGHFVPNISFGSVVVKSLLGKVDLPFDVHLMIEAPEKYLKDFVTENTEYITVHYEACPGLSNVIGMIKKENIKVGVSINPDTEVSVLEPFLGEIDLILVMSVFPGFGGQKFIPTALGKIAALKEIREKYGYHYTIEVDGGIHKGNIKEISEAGADIIVAGSAVFGAADIRKAAGELAGLAEGSKSE